MLDPPDSVSADRNEWSSVMQRFSRITVPGFSLKQEFNAPRLLLRKDSSTIERVGAKTEHGTMRILTQDPVDIAGREVAPRTFGDARAALPGTRPCLADVPGITSEPRSARRRFGRRPNVGAASILMGRPRARRRRDRRATRADTRE